MRCNRFAVFKMCAGKRSIAEAPSGTASYSSSMRAGPLACRWGTAKRVPIFDLPLKGWRAAEKTL